jgi:uncharacterized protein YndB with AHSA1/START domain
MNFMTEVKKEKLTRQTNQTKLIAEPGKQELFIEREFNAPRELVFKAYTDPKLYVQWLGPRGFTMELETFEPKSGGRWRYVQVDKEGNKFGFHGSFHEVLIPERIIDTFEYEELPERGHIILQKAVFEELPNGRSKVIAQAVFFSVADRDGLIESGMEIGVNEGYERLDEILENLQSE